MSLNQLLNHWDYGYRYDLYRHGFQIDEKNEPMSRKKLKELEKLYYSHDEIRQQEEYRKATLKKQFGDNIEGL